MNSIHFFTPVTFTGDKNWTKRALETADRYFVFTGPYISIASDNSSSLNESEKSQPRWQHVAIRIVSYCTIILPLIALATKALLRWHLNIPSTCQASSSCAPHSSRVRLPISSSASKTEQIPRTETPKLQVLFEQLEKHQKELDELTNRSGVFEGQLRKLEKEWSDIQTQYVS